MEEILGNFEKTLEPIAGQYRLTRLPKVDLEGGEICQPVVVTDTILDRQLHIRIYYTQAKGTKSVFLTADREARTNLDFALLSFYLYKSMNLPEMDAQAFYDHFKLLTEEPQGWMTVNGWNLSAYCTGSYLTFGATFN